MIHIDKEGNVIGYFDPPQGHGMAVDSKGFVYIGNAVGGMGNVRKYDPKTGKLLAELPRAPETQPGGGGGEADGGEAAARSGSRRPGTGADGSSAVRRAAHVGCRPVPSRLGPAAVAAFRAKYPPTTPMIVGGIEEVRLDEPAHELYAADNYLGGRVMVFDLDTFKFKRGWGAYGHKLSEITTDDKDRAYVPNGPEPKEFRNHLTLNISKDGLVYAADRGANRIDVTTKEGKFVKEFILAPSTACRRRRTTRPKHGPRRFRRWRGLLGRSAAAVLVYFRSLKQPRLVPQPRGRQGRGHARQHGPKRRPILRAAHDRRRFERQHLYRRGFQRREGAEVRAG